MLTLIIIVLVLLAFHWVVDKFKDSDRCYKTEQGYNCRHQILSDGKKECGNEND